MVRKRRTKQEMKIIRDEIKKYPNYTYKQVYNHLVTLGLLEPTQANYLLVNTNMKRLGIGKPESKNWETEVLPHVLKVISSADTVRGIYYRLVALNVLEHSNSNYNSLVQHLVNWRKSGVVDWRLIKDRTRHISCMDYGFANIEEYVEYKLNNLEWVGYHIPYWKGQGKTVEVWIEKDALRGLTEDVCSKYGVTVFSTRGKCSTTKLNEGNERGISVILLLTDYDEHGFIIAKQVERNMHCEVKRIALTPEQIEKYNLSPNIMDYGWEEGSYELDALEPEEYKRIIREAIEEEIEDKELWEEMREKEYEEQEIIEKAFSSLIDADELKKLILARIEEIRNEE